MGAWGLNGVVELTVVLVHVCQDLDEGGSVVVGSFWEDPGATVRNVGVRFSENLRNETLTSGTLVQRSITIPTLVVCVT